MSGHQSAIVPALTSSQWPGRFHPAPDDPHLFVIVGKDHAVAGEWFGSLNQRVRSLPVSFARSSARQEQCLIIGGFIAAAVPETEKISVSRLRDG